MDTVSNQPTTLKNTTKPVVVVPNWNGHSELTACLNSLKNQTLHPHIIVVDNGSVDDSLLLLAEQFPDIEVIRHSTNRGYAGGVNPGFTRAQELGAAYVAPFNNDAIADKNWLRTLVAYLDAHPKVGIAACKLLSGDGKQLDSTGDYYTSWGLPYPRGRGESNLRQYDNSTDIFGASGGASLYRTSMLKEIGLLDEDFFAYYEDVDISFRAQLAGWKVSYVPEAIAYHAIGATSSKIKGFTTYQTIKNYPWLLWKNVPTGLLPHIYPRFCIAYVSFIASAISRGQFGPVLKGVAASVLYLPKKLSERTHIQNSRQVTDAYIWNLLVHDLPPNAARLRALRNMWWRIRGRSK